SLIAFVARHIRLSILSASAPSSLRLSAGVLGNSAMHGMPRSRASFARSTIRSTDQRETPGRAATGSSTPLPSEMNKGQIRSAGVRTVSRTIALVQADTRGRRRRVRGNALFVVMGRNIDRQRFRAILLLPQAPGGRIRALGYAPIRRGGRSAWPRYARSGECHNCRVMGAPNRRVAEASATARPSLCEESQAGGCPRPELEVK